ncbi:AraC family transcriptional regulator [Paraburkholderia sp. J41]|uniref:AraC family transcriptional regulator n=1 Tax=Paraburkholderia sp. J41 TaxID=2805433 RepID=UPI002AC31B1B|nr:AraC family transcriptional regulator [Paraburkholderia sp. J41]
MSQAVCPPPSTPATQVFNVNLALPTRPGTIRDWSDVLYENYFPLDVAADRNFRSGELERVDIGSIRSCMLKCDAMVTERRTAHISRDTKDFYVVEMPRFSPLGLRQRGRDILVQPGDFAIVNGAESYTYAQGAPNLVHTLRIPRKVLLRRLPSVDDWMATIRHASSPVVSLFTDFVSAYVRHAGAQSVSVQATMEQHLLDLLAMALIEADPQSNETAIRTAHRQRALQAIERDFANPELSASDIAVSINLSERYLQKIFSDRDETISSVIKARRILEARRLLGKRHQHKLSITQIAYLVGFSDSAHFSRVFRQETGTSPMHYIDTE